MQIQMSHVNHAEVKFLNQLNSVLKVNFLNQLTSIATECTESLSESFYR